MTHEKPSPQAPSAGSVEAQLAALQQQVDALQRNRWKGVAMGALLVLACGAMTAVAQTVGDDLRSFSAGTPALATDVNWNFNLLKQWIEHKVGNAKTPIVTFTKGVLHDCPACGDGAVLDGTADWGDLTIQGRVLSANSNIHLSPPNGSNVVIDDAYRAAGGPAGGTAGLTVEGGLSVQGKTLANHIRDYVRGNCYVSFGWADGCNGLCDGAPTKYGSVRGDGACSLAAGADSECFNNWLGINLDGVVNEDDKFFMTFICN